MLNDKIDKKKPVLMTATPKNINVFKNPNSIKLSAFLQAL